MQWKDVSSAWVAYTPRILSRWPELDENEVLALEGDQDGFIALLATSKGEDRVAAQMELADWLIGSEPLDVTTDEHLDNRQISRSGANVPAGEEPLDDDRKFGDDSTPEPPVSKTA